MILNAVDGIVETVVAGACVIERVWNRRLDHSDEDIVLRWKFDER